jgi:hypothetical protein
MSENIEVSLFIDNFNINVSGVRENVQNVRSFLSQDREIPVRVW